MLRRWLFLWHTVFVTTSTVYSIKINLHCTNLRDNQLAIISCFFLHIFVESSEKIQSFILTVLRLTMTEQRNNALCCDRESDLLPASLLWYSSPPYQQPLSYGLHSRLIFRPLCTDWTTDKYCNFWLLTSHSSHSIFVFRHLPGILSLSHDCVVCIARSDDSITSLNIFPNTPDYFPMTSPLFVISPISFKYFQLSD